MLLRISLLPFPRRQRRGSCSVETSSTSEEAEREGESGDEGSPGELAARFRGVESSKMSSICFRFPGKELG